MLEQPLMFLFHRNNDGPFLNQPPWSQYTAYSRLQRPFLLLSVLIVGVNKSDNMDLVRNCDSKGSRVAHRHLAAMKARLQCPSHHITNRNFGDVVQSDTWVSKNELRLFNGGHNSNVLIVRIYFGATKTWAAPREYLDALSPSRRIGNDTRSRFDNLDFVGLNWSFNSLWADGYKKMRRELPRARSGDYFLEPVPEQGISRFFYLEGILHSSILKLNAAGRLCVAETVGK